MLEYNKIHCWKRLLCISISANHWRKP